MGSPNDWESMKPAADALEALGVACDVRVISAHRTPGRHHDYVVGAADAGIEVFICGAGFAAHLAGVTAALTSLPVLGVPLAVTFAQTGLVPRLPTAVLATGLVLMGLLSGAAGLILDSIAKGRLEAKRLAYLRLG